MPTPRRHYFLVADQVGHELWTNDELATITRLMSHLHERWARDGLSATEACTCVLGRGDLLRISGSGRADIARKSVGSLADVINISVERQGDNLKITWPKFAIFQGIHTRDQPERNPTIAPSDPDPDTDPDKKKKREEREVERRDSAPDGAPSPSDLAEAWNLRFSAILPTVRLPLTRQRLRHVMQRLREHPDPAWWHQAFEAIAMSPFCLGQNDRGWRANFDWLMRPDSASRVIEGNYRNGQRPQPRSSAELNRRNIQEFLTES